MEKLKLWENEVPYFNPEFKQEEPTLTPYIIDTSIKRGCVIVCPGGGYSNRADHEGKPISLMLNEGGIQSFVLNYRVSPYRHPAELEDVTRAVRYVRYHAAEWNIDPEKIGVLGFSAGGHLAMTAIEFFDYGRENGDEIDRVSSRPNAGILCYPVVSFEKNYAHKGSMYNLLGREPDPEMEHKFSGENSVRNDTPPVFMWHTAEDGGVPVENSLMLSVALKAKKIPFELHVFPYGNHGLGLAPSIPHVAQWAPLLIKWLKLYEF